MTYFESKYVDYLIQKYEDRGFGRAEGRNRIVFSCPAGFVIKLPKNKEGLSDILHEAKCKNTGRMLVEYPKHELYPRTKLVRVNGVPILLAEHVERASQEEILVRLGTIPAWVYDTDQMQVGFTKKGRLVCYDYGIN